MREYLQAEVDDFDDGISAAANATRYAQLAQPVVLGMGVAATIEAAFPPTIGTTVLDELVELLPKAHHRSWFSKLLGLVNLTPIHFARLRWAGITVKYVEIDQRIVIFQAWKTDGPYMTHELDIQARAEHRASMHRTSPCPSCS